MPRKRRRNPRDPRETFAEIESVIDRTGLPDMVSIMADICFEKAEHVASVWQDRALARVWERAGEQLQRTSQTKAIQDGWLAFGE